MLALLELACRRGRRLLGQLPKYLEQFNAFTYLYQTYLLLLCGMETENGAYISDVGERIARPF